MYEPIYEVPKRMHPWGLSIREPLVHDDNPGFFALVDVRPCGIEQHHTVQVIDQEHRPIETNVIFGYGGANIHLPISRNLWRDAPRVLKGNHQYALNGSAKHTLGEGGESIWVHHVDRDGVVKYPSVIVEGCNWINVGQGGMNEHNGVHLTFMLILKGYVPMRSQIREAAELASELSLEVDALKEKIRQLELMSPGGHRP